MAKKSQQDIAEQALRMKKAAKAPERPQNDRHGDDGPVMTPREDYPPSGAFDAEGQRPVLERSRKVR